MLLAIDVGNTQTVVGIYEDGSSDEEMLDHWRIATDRDRTNWRWRSVSSCDSVTSPSTT